MFVVTGSPTPAMAGAPTSFTYQGNLWENGLPVNATKTMRFEIWDSLTGGNRLWTGGDMSVGVTKGHYKVELDPSGFSWADMTVYLQVNVEGHAILPRDGFKTVPYALTAGANDPLVIGTLQGKSANTGVAVSSNLYVTSGNRVGIRTTSPSVELEVAGQIKITGGSPGAGKVLMSDADGLAGWNAAQGLSGAAVERDGVVLSTATGTYGFNSAFTIDVSTAGQAHLALNASSVTLQGQTFNTLSALVLMDTTGYLPVDASGISFLASASIGSGQIIDSTITLSDIDTSQFAALWMTTNTVQFIPSRKEFAENAVFAAATFPDDGVWSQDGEGNTFVAIGTDTTFGAFEVGDGNNQIVIIDADGGVNSKKWLINATDNIINIKAANDAFNSFNTFFEVSRSNTQINSVVFPNGDIGFGGGEPVLTPRSALHVFNGGYAQIENNGTTAPPAADCDSNTKRGRFYLHINPLTNTNTFYICNGAIRGWDHFGLND